MFEKLLENILGRILGEYVEGISKDQMKVGIWSGKVDISNIKIKPSVISQLNIPFELKYSKIQNIKMQIPWKNLSSSPVVVNLSGLYLLLTPLDKDMWKEIENDFVNNRHSLLVNYSKTIVETLTEKLKMREQEGGDKKGYFSKLVEKIVDNLQIKIKDIHIRLESVSNPIQNLGFGITLDRLNINTTDEFWKETFIDRTHSDTTNQTVYKKLDINNFYIYWNAEETTFLHQTCNDESEYEMKMKELINNEETKNSEAIKKLNYLMNFSTQGKLKQNRLSTELIKKNVPEFDLMIDLDTANFGISREQIKQVNQILNVVNDFSNHLKEQEKRYKNYFYRPTKFIRYEVNDEKKKELIAQWWTYALKYARSQVKKTDPWVLTTKQLRSNYKERFHDIFFDLMKQKDANDLDSLSVETKRLYENIIVTISQSELMEWIEESLKEKKIKEEIKKAKDKKKGYFGGWFGGDEQDIDDSEREQIENLIEETLESDEINLTIPEDYPKVKVMFIQNKLKIDLRRKDIFENRKESISLNTKGLEVEVSLRKNGMTVKSSLKSFKVGYSQKTLGDDLISEQNIVYCDQKGESFFSMLFESKPPELPHLDNNVNIKLSSINYIHNKHMLNTVTEIFKFDNVTDDFTEKIKQETKKKIREAKDIGENAINTFLEDQQKMLFNIEMQTPQIILPVDLDNNPKSPCWIFYPGNLIIKGDTSNINKENMYDEYSLSLIDIQFVYCKNIQAVLAKNIKIADIKNKEIEDFFYIFRNFNINIDIGMLKKLYVDMNCIDARMKVNTELNALELNFTLQVLNDLKQITNVLLVEESNYKIREKKEIISGAVKSGFFNIKENDKLKMYFCCIKSDRLYLFENPKNEDKARKIISFRDFPEVTFLNATSVIEISQQNETFYINFDNDRLYQNWKNTMIEIKDKMMRYKIEQDSIGKPIEESETVKEDKLNVMPEKSETELKRESDIVNMEVKFKFENFKLFLQNDGLKYTMSTRNLLINFKQTKANIEADIELKNFVLFFEENSNKEYLITSFYEQSLASQILKTNYIQKQEKLILIKYTQFMEEDNKLKRAEISFGSLFFDLEPGRLAQLMKMVLSENEEPVNKEFHKVASLISTSGQDHPELGPALLEAYQNNDKKKNDPKFEEVEMEIELEIQAINVLFINKLIKAPLCDIIVKDSFVGVTMRNGNMQVQANFKDLDCYDLSNYPFTLTTRQIEKIRPVKIFSKLNTEGNDYLMKINMSMKDPQIYNIDEDLSNMHLDVSIANIYVNFNNQIVMRILSFSLEQLLPAISPGDEQAVMAVPNESATGKRKFDYLFQHQSYINIHKPFWPKMNVKVNNVQVKLYINRNSHINMQISSVAVHNKRWLNKQRLEVLPDRFKNDLEGIWNDDFFVDMKGMCMVLYEGDKVTNLTSDINIGIKAQLPQHDLELECLFDARHISNYKQKHMKTNIEDTTYPKITNEHLYYDNAIAVDVKVSSLMMIMGNNEYQSIMKALDRSVLYNDGKDDLYIVDFQRKESEKKPLSLSVNLGIKNIALVTLDNSNNDKVTSKVFVEDAKLQMVMHPTTDMAMKFTIKDLQGFHLFKKGDKYYEKGFINELFVTKVYEPENNEQLKTLFIEDLLNDKDDIAEEKNTEEGCDFVFSLEQEKDVRNIILELRNLQVLIQTDVFLHLASLTAAEDKTSELARNRTSIAPLPEIEVEAKPMTNNIQIQITNNSFLIPSVDLENCLVTKGDIVLNLSIFPEKKPEVITKDQYQSVTSKYRTNQRIAVSSGDDEVDQFKTMVVKVQMKAFEIFLVKFMDLFIYDKEMIPKRPILLPWELELDFEEIALHNHLEDGTIQKESIRRVIGLVKRFRVKFSLKDTELLLGIANYQLMLLNSANKAESTESEELIKEEKEEPVPEDKYVSRREMLKNEDLSEINKMYVVMNVSDDIDVTIINDFDNLFVPTMILRVKGLKILADIEDVIKASIGFKIEILYFNSSVFRWEPFLEKATLNLDYETTVDKETGIFGKNIRFKNKSDSNLNINISIAFLERIKFLMEVYNKFLEQHENEKEKIKNVKIEKYLSQMQRNKIEEYREHIKIKEPETYIAPVKIMNNTGYKIEVHYSIKKIGITDNGSPVLKSSERSTIMVENGDSMPINIEDPLNERNDLENELKEIFNYKFISVTLMHPEFVIHKHSGLNIVQNYSKKIILKGDQKNLSDYKILFNSSTKKDLKEIMITSPAKFINTLGEDIVIKIRHPITPPELIVKKDEEVFIPFDYVRFLFDMYIRGQRISFKGKFESFSQKESGYSKVLFTENNSFNFVLKVFRDPKFYYLTKLVALPAVSFKNNLPLPISVILYNSMERREFPLGLEESFSVSDFNIKEDVIYEIKIPGFDKSEQNLLLHKRHAKYEKTIDIFDVDRNKVTFNIERLRSGYYHFNFVIFAEVVVINETPFDYIYRVSKDKKGKKYNDFVSVSENGDFKKITFVDPEKTFLQLKLKHHETYRSDDFSNVVPLQGLDSGNLYIDIAKKGIPNDNKDFIEISYKLSLVTIDEKDSIASRIIHITPKTILYNKSDFTLTLTSQNGEYVNEIGKEIKRPLYYNEYEKNRESKFNMTVDVNGSKYNSRTPVSFNRPGSSLFTLMNERDEIRIFRVEVLIQGNYTIVTFLDRHEKHDLSIKNNTSFNFNVYQKYHVGDMNLKVLSKTEEDLGFIDPYGEKVFVIECKEADDFVGMFEVKVTDLKKTEHSFKKYDKEETVVFLESDFDLLGESRCLVINKKKEDKKADKKIKRKGSVGVEQIQQESDFTNITIDISNFGISLMAKYFNRRVEMFYLYIHNMKLVAIISDVDKQLQFFIDYINIDNNYSPLARFPVLFTTLSPLMKNKQNKFLNFHTIIKNTKADNLIDLDVLEFEIQPLVVTSEFSMYNVFMALNTQLNAVFNTKSASSYLSKYFVNPENELTQSMLFHKQITEWETIQFRTSNTWIHCRELKLSQIKLIVTFSMNNYNESSTKEYIEDVNPKLIFKSLGVAFLNFDEIPLKISGLKLQNIFESQEGLSNILISHMMQQNKRNLAKVIGSFEIIGSPVSLFSNVGTGVVEFFEKPVDGFVKGPLEGFAGIAKGSGSLLKNTAAGAFNTVSKVTGSLASGLTSLSMDEKYRRQRNLARKNKPQNIFDGLGKGAKSIGRGLYSGITGVISQPYQEVRKKGAIGIFKGVFKGLGGLVTKPFGGIMDATSQTAEGLKKTVTIFDDKANEMKHRIPRVFYGKTNYFQAYHELDAKIIKQLLIVRNKQFENDTLLQTIKISGMKKDDCFHIVITYENFIIMNSSVKKIEMYFPNKNVKSLRVDKKTDISITYYFEGNKSEFKINSKTENIMKIISAMNYARYYNYASLE